MDADGVRVHCTVAQAVHKRLDRVHANHSHLHRHRGQYFLQARHLLAAVSVNQAHSCAAWQLYVPILANCEAAAEDTVEQLADYNCN